jgi:hypothetical protein
MHGKDHDVAAFVDFLATQRLIDSAALRRFRRCVRIYVEPDDAHAALPRPQANGAADKPGPENA